MPEITGGHVFLAIFLASIFAGYIYLFWVRPLKEIDKGENKTANGMCICCGMLILIFVTLGVMASLNEESQLRAVFPAAPAVVPAVAPASGVTINVAAQPPVATQ